VPGEVNAASPAGTLYGFSNPIKPPLSKILDIIR
jgi:hypothetical protein